MKTLRLSLLLLFVSSTFFLGAQKATKAGPKPASAQPSTHTAETLNWLTDINQVNNLSLSTGKPVFLFFTGSDWCGWCKKLQNDVFSKKEFIRWANDNVILMEADFPRFKALPAELSKQNSELQNTFGVQGYPTIWMFHLTPNANGQGYTVKNASSLGYPQGAEAGREQVKFLKDADAALVKIKQ